jgi:parallel beta-helix repeat protein
MSSGAAITLAANNITLDCNDFKLGGLAAGLSTQAAGVLALERGNATVRNCNIRGFRYGIHLEGSGHLVEDNRLDNNTSYGIVVGGDGSIVRRNRILDTGASTVGLVAAGISAGGSVDIIDNTVAGVAALREGQGDNFGIWTAGNLSGTVTGNRIRGIAVEASGWAIYSSGAGRVVLANNDLLGGTQAGDGGISCADAQGTAIGNAVAGFTTSIAGCTIGAGNNELP